MNEAFRRASFIFLLGALFGLAAAFPLKGRAQTPIADTQAPSVPSGLVATPLSGNEIKLTWNASTDNVGVKGYYVYLNDAALTTTTGTSFTHSGLTPGITYNYRVSAFDAVPNHSAWTATPVSATATAIAVDAQPPTVPGNLAATPLSGTQVKLTWSPSTDNVGVTGYYVYLNDAPLTTTTGTSFTHSGLTPGATYNYRVSAFDGVPNHSAWTPAPVAVKTPLVDTQPPTVPASLVATVISGDQVRLTWVASTDNIAVAGYYVYLNDAPLTATTATSFTHSGLTAGATYKYRVSAYDAVPNHSAWTATPVTVKTTLPDTQAPSVPTGLSATAVSGTQVNLAWNPSADNVAVTGYYVYLNDAPLATTTTPSFTHSGLTPGATYQYRVSAFDGVPNHSAWSPAPVTATTPVPQSAPYSGSAISVPGTFEAENFDKGGQGVAYNDTSAGNAGGQYRTGEDVDIIVSGDSAGGGYVVNNFATGEWLNYTVNVATAGNYDIDLRAATTFAASGFHVEIDGKDVTGPVSVPNTGGWNTFQWVGKQAVPLTAGKHVLKVFANQQYFNLNSIRVIPTVVPSTPYSGTPIGVPGVFEAENFDRGGEGVAYHDSAKGNVGGQYRTAEDVDIIVSSDASGGGYVVNNFATGEWLAYTINVAAAGQYDIAIRAASATATSAFHAEINGRNVTGSVAVPNTGGWSNFQWVAKTGVSLAAGPQVLKIVADQQYFNLNSISITKSGTSASPAPDTANRQFFCTFANSATDCGFSEQAKVPGRATLVSTGRDGGTAVRLHTEPGDSNVTGSGTAERNDLSLSVSATDCGEGKEAWWAHSVLFPSDYVAPPSGFAVAMDFHHTGPTGQANFHLDADRWDGKMRLRGYGGLVEDGGLYEVVLGPIVKDAWYDFVYHVRWSSGTDGYMTAWMNGRKVLDHRGPTLYAGEQCYLKLANYHDAFGQASSIIHDRIIRGSTAASVSLTPLEGVTP